jgi:hypothetical protein
MPVLKHIPRQSVQKSSTLTRTHTHPHTHTQTCAPLSIQTTAVYLDGVPYTIPFTCTEPYYTNRQTLVAQVRVLYARTHARTHTHARTSVVDSFFGEIAVL